jgi:hypothetical protein
MVDANQNSGVVAPNTFPHVMSANTDHETATILRGFFNRVERAREALEIERAEFEEEKRQFEEEKRQFEEDKEDHEIMKYAETYKIEERQKRLDQRERDLDEREAFISSQLNSRESHVWIEHAIIRCWHCGYTSHISTQCYAKKDIQGCTNYKEYKYHPMVS